MKQNFKILFLLLVLNFSFSTMAQTYLLPNEIAIISFKTSKNKIVMLAKDKDNKYLIYRYGTKEKIELEFPDTTAKSWKKFKYYRYFRGFGKQNMAMQLSVVSFINGNYEYRIYDSYYSESDDFEIGVIVIDLKTKKATDIKGKLNSKVGKLNAFNGSELLEIDDEL